MPKGIMNLKTWSGPRTLAVAVAAWLLMLYKLTEWLVAIHQL